MSERFEMKGQGAVERLLEMRRAPCPHCEVPELHDDPDVRVVESFSPAPRHVRFIWSDGAVVNVEVTES